MNKKDGFFSIFNMIRFDKKGKCVELEKCKYFTMCDFHNFGLIFTGQCTVCLKG